MPERKNALCFEVLGDKRNNLWYYTNNISENDFCGNESIFIFFYAENLPSLLTLEKCTALDVTLS